MPRRDSAGRCCAGSAVWWSWRSGTESSGPSPSARGSSTTEARSCSRLRREHGRYPPGPPRDRSSARPVGPRPRWPAGSMSRVGTTPSCGEDLGRRPAPRWRGRRVPRRHRRPPRHRGRLRAGRRAAARGPRRSPGAWEQGVAHRGPGPDRGEPRSRAGAGSSVCGHLAGGEAGQARTGRLAGRAPDRRMEARGSAPDCRTGIRPTWPQLGG